MTHLRRETTSYAPFVFYEERTLARMMLTMIAGEVSLFPIAHRRGRRLPGLIFLRASGLTTCDHPS